MEQTDQIASLVRDVLGPDAIGGYLHGSAVLEVLQPRSDIDVLVVSRARRRPQKAHSRRSSLPISGDGDESGRSRSVELTIGVESDIRPWRYPPRLDFLCGDWLRGEFERGNLANR
jgi:streptomycin 3"-adenylyltransferase